MNSHVPYIASKTKREPSWLLVVPPWQGRYTPGTAQQHHNTAVKAVARPSLYTVLMLLSTTFNMPKAETHEKTKTVPLFLPDFKVFGCLCTRLCYSLARHHAEPNLTGAHNYAPLFTYAAPPPPSTSVERGMGSSHHIMPSTSRAITVSLGSSSLRGSSTESG